MPFTARRPADEDSVAGTSEPAAPAPQPYDDEAIRALVKRLSRPQRSGARTIERASVMAEGARSAAILKWIAAHDGEAETLAPRGSGVGLHGARTQDGPRTVLRYVLPPGAVT